MDPQDAIDLGREAIRTCIFVGGPILLACLLIGLLISVVQAMTQLHDQTISFVPKIILLLITIGLCLPWLSDQMMDFARASFEKPMSHPGIFAFQQESHEVQPEGRYERQQFNSPGDERSARVASLPVSTSPFRQASRQRTKASLPSARINQDVEKREEAQPRIESPFLLPQYRYETGSPADVNDRESTARKPLEG